MKRRLLLVLLALPTLAVFGFLGLFVASALPRMWLKAAGARWHVLETPVQESLRAMWSASADDRWLVGDRGTIVRRTSAGWSQVPSGVRADLAAVWGSGPNDVWFAGGGCVLPKRDEPPCEPSVLLRWDGQALRRVETPAALPFNSVAGNAPDDVWFGARLYPQRVILHWDGSTLATRAVPGNDGGSLTALVPAGGGRLWLVSETCVRAWNGTAWAAIGRAYESSTCGEPGDAPAPLVGLRSSYAGAAKYGDGFVLYTSQPFGLAVALRAWNGTAWTGTGRCEYDGLQRAAGGWTAPDGTFWTILNDLGDVYRWRAGQPCERVARLPIVPTGMGGLGTPWVLGTRGRVLAAGLD
ncbi:MAG TPA: hypothetical protein VFS00_29325 [Polyangiaceae bacterium]|nr:hypothetical protein [Polyangiaceae bacterium]